MVKHFNAMPLVSVVMPTLNQVQFLESAVRSVLEQDHAHIELVIADGMSTDGTLRLLARLQAEFGERLRWFSQQDQGAADALNHAIAMAHGDILGWLNSDDLYADGAVSRAVEHFAQHPMHQMVYGEGVHINVFGEAMGKYPSKPPSTPIDTFADGSFICQPTVFMRREALQQVGALDANIQTAFDFDLFVRFFKRYPRQIGIIRRIQAYSRLHDGCMTRRLRKQVALDGISVVAKELGKVPDHWFWTFVDEICDSYPYDADRVTLVKQIEAFLKQAKTHLPASQLQGMLDRLKTDQRLRLASPNLFATVQPDGWVSRQVTIRYRWEEKPAAAVLVKCIAPWPIPGLLRLRVAMPNGKIQKSVVEVPEEFVLRFEVDESASSGFTMWTVETAQSFVPAKHDKKSTDSRKLAFQVLGLSLEA